MTDCQASFKRLLPLTHKETEFLNLLLDKGEIQPELISDDPTLIENVKLHPAIKWSAQNKDSE